MSGLTATELAQRAGTTPEWIERLTELGILESKKVALHRALIRDSSPVE